MIGANVGLEHNVLRGILPAASWGKWECVVAGRSMVSIYEPCAFNMGHNAISGSHAELLCLRQYRIP
jgi:hypothetical protein